MGRINSWLLRHIDKLPDPERLLPPKLEQMRVIIGRRAARATLIAVMSTAAYVFVARLTMHLWYGLLITVPVILVLSFLVMAVVDYQSRMAVHDYMRWLRTQKVVPPRSVRLGVPYERRAPVATTACQSCPAMPGERHSRSCSAVPPQWYRQSRRG